MHNGREMVKEFTGFRKATERELTMLDNASDLKDLLSSAGNRLEKLRGDWAGQVDWWARHSYRGIPIADRAPVYLAREARAGI